MFIRNEKLLNLIENLINEKEKFDSIYNQILNNTNQILGSTKSENGVNEDGTKWYKNTFTSNDGSFTSTSYVSSNTLHNNWFSIPTNKITTNSELSNLKKALNEAVESQDFEQAVKLRDLIKNQEKNNDKLIELNHKLANAINTHNFEEAIILRDSIKKLESK